MPYNIQGALLRKRKDRGTEYRAISHLASQENLLDFQERYLKALLLHAYENAPYHHRAFDEIGLIESGQVDLSKFDRIPILTKNAIRRFSRELTSKDYKTRHWHYGTTGGSTGQPLRFIHDREMMKWVKATEYYYYKDVLGIAEPTARKVLLWGSERDVFEGSIGIKAKLVNRLTHTVLLNSFRMTREDMNSYIDKINSYKPDIVTGYAGSLFELCQYADGKNVRLHSPQIVISAAETLHDEMRAVIESTFGSSVFNFYGSREAPCMAAECMHGSLHVFSCLYHLELLDDENKKVKKGEEGKVVVTSLHNYSMPFIRYEIGDSAIEGADTCSCGSALPTLEKVTGRIVDRFVTENGATVPAEFFIHLIGVVCPTRAIEKFQVVQEDYTNIRILVVLQNELPRRYKEDIEGKIRKLMGSCNIAWDSVDDIPKSASGKYIYTRSLVHNETD